MGKEKKNISGIYKITNTKNGKIYIGQSANINSRRSKHIDALKRHQHANFLLQKDWDRQVPSDFIFEVIEEVPVELLNEKEIYYIKHFQCIKHGYNMCRGGNGIRGYKHSAEEISKMRRIQSPPIILQFDLNFNFIQEWEGGASHIVKEISHTSLTSLWLRCRHLGGEMKPYKNFYWVYKDEYNSPAFTWDNYLNNIPCIDIGKLCNLKIREPISQYDLQGNFIKTWETAADLINSQYDIKKIKISCNHTLEYPHSYKNYIWAYKSDDIFNGYFDKILKRNKYSS